MRFRMNNSDSEGEEGNVMSQKHSELLKLCVHHNPKLLTAEMTVLKKWTSTIALARALNHYHMGQLFTMQV